jgi:sugar phosphate permease
LTLLYAVGQFVNGQLGDRFGARRISALGAVGSALLNGFVFLTVLWNPNDGISKRDLLWVLVLFWGVNGFFQAMGWSPMVRVMAHWFPIAGRGRIMGLLGTSYQLGAAFAQLLAIFLTGYWVQKMSGDWRMVFLVPAALLLAAGIFFGILLRNRPEEVGLPPVDETGHEDRNLISPSAVRRPAQRTIWANIIVTVTNPRLWIVACAFFLLDANRYGFVNWLPAYVDKYAAESRGALLADFKRIMTICIHPLAGSLGVVICGWATDRFFGGRRAPVIAMSLALLGIFSILFSQVNPGNDVLLVVVVAAVGFFTYGAHILMVGHAAQDFGDKEGSAGAAGFIDSMGYIGASLAGWGAGEFIDLRGYPFTFSLAGICALAGAALICMLWKATPQRDAHDGKRK